MIGKLRDLFTLKTQGFDDTDFEHREIDDIVVELEEKYRRYRSKASEWREEVIENDRFRNGKQWTESQKRELQRKRQAPIVVNVISPAVDQLKSMLTANNPRFNAIPREGSARDTARLFSDIFAWIWDFNKANRVLKQCIDHYSVRGLGYMMPWWDPEADFGKGEVVLETINPLHVYVDPSSEDPLFRDADHVMIVRDYTGEQIQKNLRIDSKFLQNCVTTDHEDEGNFVNVEAPFIDEERDQEVPYYQVIDSYEVGLRPYCHYKYDEYEYNVSEDEQQEYENQPVLRIESRMMQGEQPTDSDPSDDYDDGMVMWAVEDDEFDQWTHLIEQFGSVFHFIPQQDPETGEQTEVPMPGPATDQAVRETRIAESTISNMVSEGYMKKNEYSKQEVYRKLVIGKRKYYEGWTDLTEYPIIPFVNRHNGNPYPVGDISMTKDLQKELNKIRSTILTHAANTASVKVALPKGSTSKSQAEEDLGKSGISVVEYDPVDGAAPHFIHPPQLPSHFYQSEDKIRESIYEIFGIFPFMGGAQEGGHSTSSGILIMDEFAQRRISDKRNDIEESLNQLASVIVQLVQQYYTEEKTIRIAQPSGRYNEVNINSPVYDSYSGRLLHRINDVTIGRYDVIVSSGSTLPSNRITRLEYFMKLYQAQLIDQYEVLKNVDEVDVEGVMERMGMLQQMQQTIQQMQQQIKSLEGDLQTADREAVSARKRLEVEKFKANLDKMNANIDKQLNASKEREMSNFREGLSDQRQQQDDQQGAPGSPEPIMLDQELYEEINQMR